MEEARDLNNQERLKVVSCDGTLFRPNGTFTGGTGKGDDRAGRWDEAAYEKLKQQRDEVKQQKEVRGQGVLLPWFRRNCFH